MKASISRKFRSVSRLGILLLLLATQTAVLAHEIGHESLQSQDNCLACSVGHDLDAVSLDSASCTTFFEPHAIALLAKQGWFSAEFFNSHRARAPPVLL